MCDIRGRCGRETALVSPLVKDNNFPPGAPGAHHLVLSSEEFQ